jgi:hypothetical protein
MGVQNPTGHESLHDAVQWVRNNVVFDHNRQENILEVHIATVFPISSDECYQIITHPDGDEIFRGISSCVRRQILENDGHGNMILEVHNQSDWNVLGLVKGSVVTKLLVEQSMQEQLLHFGMVPGSSQMLNDLYGVWRIYDFCDPEIQKYLSFPDDKMAEYLCHRKNHLLKGRSLVTLYQRFEFNNDRIPKVLRGPVSGAAIGQLKHTFEDLILEIWKIQLNQPTLTPYMSSIMKEINLENFGEEVTKSADSVKTILDEKAAASTQSASKNVNDAIQSKIKDHLDLHFEGREIPSEMDYSAQVEPVSHPLMRRLGSLGLSRRMSTLAFSTRANSLHSINSLASLACLTEAEEDAEKNAGFFKRLKNLIDRYLYVKIEALDPDSQVESINDPGFDMFGENEWLVVA